MFNNMNDEMDKNTVLMLKLKNGDRVAFDELYRRFNKKIYNYVFRMAGNKETAEDITQEVFVKMYVSAKYYEPTGKFTTWLFTIATNTIINEHRKDKRTTSLEAEPSVDAEQFTENRIIINEMEQDLLNSINNLPENQKTVIVLRSYEGMDYEEIAKVINNTTKAVKSLLNRARKRLSNEYKKSDM
ncbi:MAG: RNA polymerase sigma factor [Deltaproteobacteria bacterium]|nr:RNA polymerase sigma factor [Deltaproteobacteria bacterium]